MQQWYYRNGANQIGPLNDAQMKSLAAKGALAPNTLVWNATLPSWITAAQAGLVAVAPGAVPPPPAAPAASITLNADSFKAAGRGFLDFVLGRNGAIGLFACAAGLRVISLVILVCGVFQLGAFKGFGVALAWMVELDGSFWYWLGSVVSAVLVAYLPFTLSLILSALRDVLRRLPTN